MPEPVTMAPDADEPAAQQVRLRREVVVPVVPSQWLWTYLAVKAVLVFTAMATMAALAR